MLHIYVKCLALSALTSVKAVNNNRGLFAKASRKQEMITVVVAPIIIGYVALKFGSSTCF